jgi:hypothetical protein
MADALSVQKIEYHGAKPGCRLGVDITTVIVLGRDDSIAVQQQ